MSIELPVLVEKVVFRNEKGFAILACSLNPYSIKYNVEMEDLIDKNTKKNKYNNFTVTIGTLSQYGKVEGKQYIFVGEFVKNDKYGDQFKAEFHYADMPTNEDGLREYLMEFPYIKQAISADIIKTFGFDETIRILNEEPLKLTTIKWITEERVKPIKDKWDSEKTKRDLYMWLIDHGIPPTIGEKVYAKWFDESLKILQDNPYRLTEIKGFGFKRADFIAHKILKEVPKLYRLVACISYLLTENVYKNSNLCMPLSALRNLSISTLRECSEENSTDRFIAGDYESLVNRAIKENLDKFVAVRNINETTNGSYVYIKEIWEKEKYIATNLYHRSIGHHKNIHPNDPEKDNPYSIEENDLVDAERDVSQFGKREIKLDDCQKEAIKSAFDNKVTVITGGGGTGKSTICRCIYHLAEEKRLTIRMMSPTGKASQVLTNKTGFPAETIHRSLKMQPGEDLPKESIREDMVIIDEVSMVGIDTMFAIMHALEANSWCHVVWVGDCNQLPSVSPGNFLSDMMQSGVAHVVPLTKVHRQDENSYIAVLANDISNGKIVTVPPDATDIKWHDLNNQEDFEITMKRLVKEFISSSPIDDLQIISPMYKGSYGVNKINEVVQNIMSKENETDKESFKRGFITFYVGDRVIQLENNYEKKIFNGDIGTIVSAGRKITNPEISDAEKDFVTVNFYGEHLTYLEEEIDQLRLAWCITIHKFQGSQSPNIYFIFSRESSNMASKELLYTGMTRAEKHLDIYGHTDVFRIAPTKSAIRKRFTNINNIVKELKENRKILQVLESEKKVK